MHHLLSAILPAAATRRGVLALGTVAALAACAGDRTGPAGADAAQGMPLPTVQTAADRTQQASLIGRWTCFDPASLRGASNLEIIYEASGFERTTIHFTPDAELAAIGAGSVDLNLRSRFTVSNGSIHRADTVARAEPSRPDDPTIFFASIIELTGRALAHAIRTGEAGNQVEIVRLDEHELELINRGSAEGQALSCVRGDGGMVASAGSPVRSAGPRTGETYRFAAL